MSFSHIHPKAAKSLKNMHITEPVQKIEYETEGKPVKKWTFGIGNVLKHVPHSSLDTST